MKKHSYSAPITVALILIALVLGYVAFLYLAISGSLNTNLVVKIVVALVALLVIGALIVVLIQRIREIQGGNEDDISKY